MRKTLAGGDRLGHMTECSKAENRRRSNLWLRQQGKVWMSSVQLVADVMKYTASLPGREPTLFKHSVSASIRYITVKHSSYMPCKNMNRHYPSAVDMCNSWTHRHAAA